MSNIGGAATMVGDPPALIIGTALSNYLGGLQGRSTRGDCTNALVLASLKCACRLHGFRCKHLAPGAHSCSRLEMLTPPCCLPDLLFSGFMDFIVNMAPGVIMAAVVCIPLLLWQFRRALRG